MGFELPMPATDQCEDQVIKALRKDGWQIVDNPFPSRLTEYYNYAFADLRCQRRVNGVSQQVIVVEIKYFSRSGSFLHDFYGAVGQYVFYRNAMRLEGYADALYLAVPDWLEERLFSIAAAQDTIAELNILLVYIDLVEERIIKWTNT
jgi:hypothetical protein